MNNVVRSFSSVFVNSIFTEIWDNIERQYLMSSGWVSLLMNQNKRNTVRPNVSQCKRSLCFYFFFFFFFFPKK